MDWIGLDWINHRSYDCCAKAVLRAIGRQRLPSSHVISAPNTFTFHLCCQLCRLIDTVLIYAFHCGVTLFHVPLTLRAPVLPRLHYRNSRRSRYSGGVGVFVELASDERVSEQRYEVSRETRCQQCIAATRY